MFLGFLAFLRLILCISRVSCVCCVSRVSVTCEYNPENKRNTISRTNSKIARREEGGAAGGFRFRVEAIIGKLVVSLLFAVFLVLLVFAVFACV